MNQQDYPQSPGRENGNATTCYSRDATLNVSQAQILARQSVNAKLPTFSGNPEEWNAFDLCGFSDGENIARLQQALKGDALRTVQGRLRHAANLREVMEELKSSFGRPESLVDELGLEGSDRPLCLKWTGGQHRMEPNSKQVSVSIMGTSCGAQKFQASNVRSVKCLGLPPQR
uniref:Uncharacterized protein n=1 Tax=Anopheles epiroticus TaxID=199890 RepID=A0A182PWQ3_9DIPT